MKSNLKLASCGEKSSLRADLKLEERWEPLNTQFLSAIPKGNQTYCHFGSKCLSGLIPFAPRPNCPWRPFTPGDMCPWVRLPLGHLPPDMFGLGYICPWVRLPLGCLPLDPIAPGDVCSWDVCPLTCLPLDPFAPRDIWSWDISPLGYICSWGTFAPWVRPGANITQPSFHLEIRPPTGFLWWKELTESWQTNLKLAPFRENSSLRADTILKERWEPLNTRLLAANPNDNQTYHHFGWKIGLYTMNPSQNWLHVEKIAHLELTLGWKSVENFKYSVTCCKSQWKSNLPSFWMKNKSLRYEIQPQTSFLWKKQLFQSWHLTEREMRSFKHQYSCYNSQDKSNLPPFWMKNKSLHLEIQHQTGFMLRADVILKERWGTLNTEFLAANPKGNQTYCCFR